MLFGLEMSMTGCNNCLCTYTDAIQVYYTNAVLIQAMVILSRNVYDTRGTLVRMWSQMLDIEVVSFTPQV